MTLIRLVRSTGRHLRREDPRRDSVHADFDTRSTELLSHHLIELAGGGLGNVVLHLVLGDVGDSGDGGDVDDGG